MSIRKLFITIICLLIPIVVLPQDRRTLDTKIADLLAQMPASDLRVTDKLMADMLELGEEGLMKICNQIVPAGTGDDTKPRFAIESLSRSLSVKGKEQQRSLWEKMCITFATKVKDPEVKDFFIKQLQVIGGEQTVEALGTFLTDKVNCAPAVAAITAIGGTSAENILAASLNDKSLTCAASVMNALAGMNSGLAVKEYIEWSSTPDINIRASAYNALARSGSLAAYPVLMDAAKEYGFRWESSGATASLLNYAGYMAANGDMKTMDKICKFLISKCNDDMTFQTKTAALGTYVTFHKADAMPLILKAASHPDKKFRNAAINMSALIPGDEVIAKWEKYLPKANPDAKAEIISMLGIRGDEKSLGIIRSSLSDKNTAVRIASAAALAKISGKRSVPDLIKYISNFDSAPDQEAAIIAFKSAAGSSEVALLKPVLRDASPAVKKSIIEIMAWNKGEDYFSEILPYTSSPDDQIKGAAFKALPSLAGPDDQDKLIALLLDPGNKAFRSEIQDALISAASKINDPQKRPEAILNAMVNKGGKELLIPVLAKTGGREALNVVLREFENGNPEMREICFKALTSWSDYSASSALYEICASGNKTYEEPAFNGYVRQIRSAKIPDDQKLLLLRKIMPFALSAERKNEILAEAGKLRTYLSLFFVAGYLDDPSTSATAARSAMDVALPSVSSKEGMSGINVREILNKAIPLLTGPESDYDKEMVRKYLASMPADEGFVPLFNGIDLSGWQGLVENPIVRSKLKSSELAVKQREADARVPLNWSVRDGCIWFSGKGQNLCTIKEYADFEMLVDWKISKEGDSGIYLRGTPQVQIWDTSRVKVGAQVGSGGLYNNKINPSKPSKVADNPVGDWNTFRIIMTGEKVSIWLNGELVVDNVTLENYWDRNIPIFPKGPIELQAHGTDLAFRDIYVREISPYEVNLIPEEKSEGFEVLFNGKNLDNWLGNKESYLAENGMIVIRPDKGSGGNLYTEKEYSDFIFRFEFQLTPGANNGLGIRAPLTGDAAYSGMELQILDDYAPVYSKLQPYQYHGSVYGVIPAKRGSLKPAGEWNIEEVFVKGTQIMITLNGNVIVDGDIAGPRDNGTMDHKDHPGLKNNTGHIGFLGHGSVVRFRNIRIKDLSK